MNMRPENRCYRSGLRGTDSGALGTFCVACLRFVRVRHDGLLWIHSKIGPKR